MVNQGNVVSEAQIFDATIDNVRELLAASQQQPVLFFFWSSRSQESLQLDQLLTSKVQQAAGHLVLAKVDCDQQQDLAMQFGIQALPTVLIIKDGQPADGFAGPMDAAGLDEKLAGFLPKPEDELLQQAHALLANQSYSEAFPLLSQALQLAPKRPDIKLSLADCAVELGQLEQAEELLATILLEDQNADFKAVQAKLKLAKEAADTPEIQALEAALAAEPDNMNLKEQLAVQYQQVKRSAEALELLYSILQKDLAFSESRKLYLNILAAMPQGDATASSYRRKLYSLLY